MPLPLIWMAIAGGSALLGVKKTSAARASNAEARETNASASRLVASAAEELKRSRAEVQRALEQLGVLKLKTWRDGLGRFVEVFGRLRHVTLAGDLALSDRAPPIGSVELARMRELSSHSAEVLAGGMAGLGTGALAGIASYGGAVAFASATTGTAIASLSGAAATHATLAFFGGGAIAAGGAGIAGGALILGGLVSGPALAAFGLVSSARASKNLARARRNLCAAEASAAELRLARAGLDGVAGLARSFTRSIEQLSAQLGRALDRLEAVIEARGTDYGSYADPQRRRVFEAVECARLVKVLLETPLLETDGSPRTAACEEALAVVTTSGALCE